MNSLLQFMRNPDFANRMLHTLAAGQTALTQAAGQMSPLDVAVGVSAAVALLLLNSLGGYLLLIDKWYRQDYFSHDVGHLMAGVTMIVSGVMCAGLFLPACRRGRSGRDMYFVLSVVCGGMACGFAMSYAWDLPYVKQHHRNLYSGHPASPLIPFHAAESEWTLIKGWSIPPYMDKVVLLATASGVLMTVRIVSAAIGNKESAFAVCRVIGFKMMVAVLSCSLIGITLFSMSEHTVNMYRLGSFPDKYGLRSEYSTDDIDFLPDAWFKSEFQQPWNQMSPQTLPYIAAVKAITCLVVLPLGCQWYFKSLISHVLLVLSILANATMIVVASPVIKWTKAAGGFLKKASTDGFKGALSERTDGSNDAGGWIKLSSSTQMTIYGVSCLLLILLEIVNNILPPDKKSLGVINPKKALKRLQTDNPKKALKRLQTDVEYPRNTNLQRIETMTPPPSTRSFGRYHTMIPSGSPGLCRAQVQGSPLAGSPVLCHPQVQGSPTMGSPPRPGMGYPPILNPTAGVPVGPVRQGSMPVYVNRGQAWR